MRQKKIVLVTGATGFLAQYLIPFLRKKGYYVVGLARSSQCDLFIDEYHSINLLDRISLTNLMQKISPDFVVHLAGISFVNHPAWEDLYAMNVLATKNLLDELKDANGKCRVLLASSATVYGENANGCIDETVMPKPKNDYGKSKLAMEELANDFSDFLPITIVRFFNFIGPGQSNVFLVPKLVEYYSKKKPVLPLGNMEVSRDFSDVRDVCASLEKLLALSENKNDSNVAIYNVSSGHATQLKEILCLLNELTSHSPNVVTDLSLVRQNEIVSLWGSNEKLRKNIDVSNRYSLKETLSWMLENDFK